MPELFFFVAASPKWITGNSRVYWSSFGMKPTIGIGWIAQWHRAQFCIEYRGRDCHVRASQTYHQDQHPDRTFHGYSPYAAKFLGGNLAVAALYRGAAVRPVFSPAWPSGRRATLVIRDPGFDFGAVC